MFVAVLSPLIFFQQFRGLKKVRDLHIYSHSPPLSKGMQLLIQLPRLPFSAVFDILFRHGGFVAFADAHGPEAMYQFWRIFFVSSPMGKLDPLKISAWVEAVCACHIVQSLPHPAHAVYLLRPVRFEIPESVSAWAIAGGRGNQTIPPNILITAMKVFLDRNWPDQPLLQREWFCVSELLVKRSAAGWMQFVNDIISNHLFTRYWWNQQKECPFRMLDGAHGSLSMGKVIVLLSQRETLALRHSLKRAETVSVIRALRRKKWIREHSGRSSNPPPCSKKGAIAERPKPPPILLSSDDKKEIVRLAQSRYVEHTKTLSQVNSTLGFMQVATLDDHFHRVLSLVVSLGRAFPRIKWSLRLALHKVADETGRSVWDIERDLHRAMHAPAVQDPLTKLKRMSHR